MISKLSSFTLSALMVMTFSDVEYTNVLAAPEDDKDPFA